MRVRLFLDVPISLNDDKMSCYENLPLSRGFDGRKPITYDLTRDEVIYQRVGIGYSRLTLRRGEHRSVFESKLMHFTKGSYEDLVAQFAKLRPEVREAMAQAVEQIGV